MLTPDQIVDFHIAARPHVAGNHLSVAEGFREKALHALTKTHLLVGTLEIMLREQPDDDQGFETIAAAFRRAFQEAGEYVQAFRDTRDVIGEA